MEVVHIAGYGAQTFVACQVAHQVVACTLGLMLTEDYAPLVMLPTQDITQVALFDYDAHTSL